MKFRGEGAASSFKKKSIRQQKREEEYERRKEYQQATQFINRLVEDGVNIITDNTKKMMDSVTSKIKGTIENALQESLNVMINPTMFKIKQDKAREKISESSSIK